MPCLRRPQAFKYLLVFVWRLSLRNLFYLFIFLDISCGLMIRYKFIIIYIIYLQDGNRILVKKVFFKLYLVGCLPLVVVMVVVDLSHMLLRLKNVNCLCFKIKHW